MTTQIPVFPLRLVIFPGSSYPLHIFEERYKKMINRCINNNEDFIIVSSLEKEISTVGCIVRIMKIINTYEDGRFDIIVTGKNRVRIVSTAIHEDGYLTGEADKYSEPELPESALTGLYDLLITNFNKVLSTAKISLESTYWRALELSEYKSYKIAEKAGLNLAQRQTLLTLPGESERLEFLNAHMIKLLELLDKATVIDDIVSGDGYLNP